MKVDQKEHFITIKDTQGNLDFFLSKVTHEYKTFEKKNIIIDITLYKSLSINEINKFLALSKKHKKAKKSFIVVADAIDFNGISTKLTVVPTTQEAHDIIEMEEIERDLGF